MGSNQIICLISFTDSLLYGLFVPFTSSIILKLGGTHTSVGVLGSLRAILNMYSNYLVIAVINKIGFNDTFTLTLSFSCLTFFVLWIGVSSLSAIYLRCLYHVTNQTSYFCKVYLIRNEENESRVFTTGLMYICSFFGLVIGPLLTGVLLTFDGGLTLILFISTIISLISAVSSLYIKDLPRFQLESAMKDDILSSLRNIRNLKWKKQWSVLVLRYFLLMGNIAYIAKFPLLLTKQFGASPILIGCSYAYMKAMSFISKYLISQYNHQINVKISHMRTYFASYFVFMLFMCFAKRYDYYLLGVTLYVLCDIYIESKWQIMYKESTDDSNDIERATETVTFLCKIITPVLIGISCDKFNHNVVRVFCCSSTAVALIISYYVPKENND